MRRSVIAMALLIAGVAAAAPLVLSPRAVEAQPQAAGLKSVTDFDAIKDRRDRSDALF